MSGAKIKTLSLLSFLILAVGLVVCAPGADAASVADGGEGTESSPFSGTVSLDPFDFMEVEDNAQCTVYVVAGSDLTVQNDSYYITYSEENYSESIVLGDIEEGTYSFEITDGDTFIAYLTVSVVAADDSTTVFGIEFSPWMAFAALAAICIAFYVLSKVI